MGHVFIFGYIMTADLVACDILADFAIGLRLPYSTYDIHQCLSDEISKLNAFGHAL